MRASIWKWELILTDRQVIRMPRGSRLLAVQMQYLSPQLWAFCDADAPQTDREIAIYGTGNPLPDDAGTYIGTFQMGWRRFCMARIRGSKGAIMSMTEEGKTGQRLPKPYALELLHRQLAEPWLIRMAYDRETVLYLQWVTARWVSSAVPEGSSKEEAV